MSTTYPLAIAPTIKWHGDKQFRLRPLELRVAKRRGCPASRLSSLAPSSQKTEQDAPQENVLLITRSERPGQAGVGKANCLRS
jgi:hypothetical protein